MSEYIIITALVAVAGIGIFAAFGDTISNQAAAMAQEMAGQDGSSKISDAQDSADTAGNRADQDDDLSSYDQQTGTGGGGGGN